MDKRNLSKIERPVATECVMNMANRITACATHVVTAELIENKKILLLNFFKIKDLAKGNTEAEFRTFLSHEDYITQDLNVSMSSYLSGGVTNSTLYSSGFADPTFIFGEMELSLITFQVLLCESFIVLV